MKNKRLRSSAPSRKKGNCGPPNSIDEISKMPDDVLVMILSRLLVKDAVVTGSLSTRWKNLWHKLTRLNFDGTEALNKMVNDEMLSDLERGKFISQVNNVIRSHSYPTVKEFLITFDLDGSYYEHIDKWIQFVLEKKVEKLELDFIAKTRHLAENYYLRLPSLDAMAVKTLSLKEIFLTGINLTEPSLDVLLKNSPHLVKLGVNTSYMFAHVRVGGRDINLKYFMLMDCCGFESISLYGFDLVTFVYSGPVIEFHLTDLPKLTKLEMGDVSLRLENNVFAQLSSCAANLRVLTLDIWTPKVGLDFNAIIKFPYVKKLTLVMAAYEDDCLLAYTAIARACPRLEIFSVSLSWYTPMELRREVRHVSAREGHEHLELLEIFGYYGRISDLELAVYVIETAVALKEIVIDPSCYAFGDNLSALDCLERRPTARSSAKRQLTSRLPPGVHLTVL